MFQILVSFKSNDLIQQFIKIRFLHLVQVSKNIFVKL